MLPKLRTMVLAGVAALGGLLGGGANDAKAQVFLGTPGLSVGVGAPVVGAYPVYGYGYGVAPVYPAVRPYPYWYGYGGRGFYRPAPFVRRYEPYYGHRAYRRW